MRPAPLAMGLVLFFTVLAAVVASSPSEPRVTLIPGGSHCEGTTRVLKVIVERDGKFYQVFRERQVDHPDCEGP